MFGLAPVKGTFGTVDGELTVDTSGARGELRITAATLDTRNSKRDKHLRSADFFHAEQHPTIVFTLTDITHGPGDDLLATGVLRIRDNTLEITTPLAVTAHDDHLHLSTEISVDRTAAGLGWSKLGMIQGQAHLHAEVVLARQG
jgi:polyisoprenoid-binding protein YceI